LTNKHGYLQSITCLHQNIDSLRWSDRQFTYYNEALGMAINHY